MIDGRVVHADEYFQTRKNIATTFHPDHARVIGPDRCRNPGCPVPSHHDWKIRKHRAQEFGLDWEDPLHPEHDGMAQQFCKHPYCRIHDKGDYPTKSDLAGKDKALSLRGARLRSLIV